MQKDLILSDEVFPLERATRLELASRHPTNRLRRFAGALPHLKFKTRFARGWRQQVRAGKTMQKDLILSDEVFSGAGNEARTRYLHLGKVALYQMSYARGTRCILTDESHLVKHFHQFSSFSFSRVSAVPSSKVPSGSSASSPVVFSGCAAAKAASSSSVGSSRNSTSPTGPSAG